MRPLTACACGKSGRFKRPGLCAWCAKEETRVYDPVKQKQYFDKWYAAQRESGYPAYDWAERNERARVSRS